MHAIIKGYSDKKKDIVNYIINHSGFIETYGKITYNEMIERLEQMTIPWIFLHEQNQGTIAYTDGDYVIEFAFDGIFENLYDLDISG